MANNNMAFILIAAGAAVIGATILLKPKEEEDEDEEVVRDKQFYQKLTGGLYLGDADAAADAADDDVVVIDNLPGDPARKGGEQKVKDQVVLRPKWEPVGWDEPIAREHNQVWITR